MRKNIFLSAGFFILNIVSLFSLARDTSFITSTIQWDLPATIAYAKQNNIITLKDGKVIKDSKNENIRSAREVLSTLPVTEDN